MPPHAPSGDAAPLYPVILSGGAGTRLWPMSRALYPKQFLPLAGPDTMLQATARRVAGPGFAAPLVICNEDHRFLVAEQVRAAGLTPGGILLEPEGRNTAPAATVAALSVARADPDGVVLLMPSDHVIADVTAFHESVAMAARAARQGLLVTFGITPEHPETGYGYIRAGAPLEGVPGVHHVARFIEKPDQATADGYLTEGGYLWNGGIFAFTAGTFLEEMARLHPDTVTAARVALDEAAGDLDFVRLAAAPFAGTVALSIDHAVMEHTERAAVVPVSMGWNDVGAWGALWDIGHHDDAGNVLVGDVLADETRDSYIRSEGPLVTVVGLTDAVVVATDDAVLVAPRDQATKVKEIVARLGAAGRPEGRLHPTVYRPWGSFRGIDHGERFQVKQIVVNPGARLSLQMHHHRAEHWIVVEGTARVTRGQESFLLHENQSTFIPLGTMHRLENPGKLPLRIIEVQSGPYLGEDDIVRLDDTYGRT
ncbi:mannose-1-phosphate guanylyltransferase/mannose-6-phosphate isomerase [Roseospira visakhapatnamensis]|uniref:mannose-1-phosphate guanylyltransferase n=1 Tax=Roseospira visakhapatnamensis TaxID=390880 RepID=A0A7W6W8Y2_9PROT|nr:mannose-1-phosphate guanylyltransferase/mannose-6-phosphate isomerase [Roseospira visakhapatnamensis]MBB4264891.1 mannose-1-phosphate guanylyltransferase/mannose-6-phosphate isomerase [Roseospira visakhapatnamensis]